MFVGRRPTLIILIRRVGYNISTATPGGTNGGTMAPRNEPQPAELPDPDEPGISEDERLRRQAVIDEASERNERRTDRP